MDHQKNPETQSMCYDGITLLKGAWHLADNTLSKQHVQLVPMMQK